MPVLPLLLRKLWPYRSASTRMTFRGHFDKLKNLVEADPQKTACSLAIWRSAGLEKVQSLASGTARVMKNPFDQAKVCLLHSSVRRLEVPPEMGCGTCTLVTPGSAGGKALGNSLSRAKNLSSTQKRWCSVSCGVVFAVASVTNCSGIIVLWRQHFIINSCSATLRKSQKCVSRLTKLSARRRGAIRR